LLLESGEPGEEEGALFVSKEDIGLRFEGSKSKPYCFFYELSIPYL